MKRFKNVTNRHLQFFYAKIEMAPGQELNIGDNLIKEDPGLAACIEHEHLVEVKEFKRSKQTGSKKSTPKDSESGMETKLDLK